MSKQTGKQQYHQFRLYPDGSRGRTDQGFSVHVNASGFWLRYTNGASTHDEAISYELFKQLRVEANRNLHEYRKLVHDSKLQDKISDDRMCVCGNCGYEEWESQLQVPLTITPDLQQRLDPGSEVPAGECSNCGALTYHKYGKGRKKDGRSR